MDGYEYKLQSVEYFQTNKVSKNKLREREDIILGFAVRYQLKGSFLLTISSRQTSNLRHSLLVITNCSEKKQTLNKLQKKKKKLIYW
jgi:hypothetical protein